MHENEISDDAIALRRNYVTYKYVRLLNMAAPSIHHLREDVLVFPM